MLLTIVGLLMVLAIITLLMLRKVSPLVAFATIPPIAALLVGNSLADVGTFISEGMTTVFPTAALFIFAILFFGIVRERGLFTPIVNGMVRATKGDPLRVCVATVLVAALVHLDGIGAATFLITIPAFLDLYDRLNMRRTVLLCLAGVSVGIMNLVPWGGPTARAAAALEVDPVELWRPLVPVQAFGLVLMLAIAVYFGLRERRTAHRLASAEMTKSFESQGSERSGLELSPRQWLYWFNVTLTVATLAILITGILPSFVVFAISLGIALVVNYPSVEQQMEQLLSHAREALNMGVILLAAGAFLGVLSGSGMLDNMTDSLLSLLPAGAAQFAHIIVGAFAVPIGMAFGPDPYYFGILPIVNEIASSAGVPAESVAHAMLLGENVGFVVSPVIPTVYLLVGLGRVDLGQHIRFTFPWAWGVSVAMMVFAIVIGIIHF